MRHGRAIVFRILYLNSVADHQVGQFSPRIGALDDDLGVGGNDELLADGGGFHDDRARLSIYGAQGAAIDEDFPRRRGILSKPAKGRADGEYAGHRYHESRKLFHNQLPSTGENVGVIRGSSSGESS